MAEKVEEMGLCIFVWYPPEEDDGSGGRLPGLLWGVWELVSLKRL